MSSTHDHDDNDHDHAPASFGRAFGIGITLNLAFVAAEVVYGLLSNSVALLADAGHNFSDVLGLAVAWLASVLVKRAPSARFSYGLRGSSILAALFNAVVLLIAVGALGWEAFGRFYAPEPIASTTVVIVALIGIAVNGTTAWLFAKGAKGDINLRGAFLHMASDAVLSAGVVVAALVIAVTHWLWLDPLTSLVINAVIIWSTWALLRESLGMALAAVPMHIDVGAVRAHLLAQPGVAALHDLHIWPMSTTEVALTCHLVMPDAAKDDFLHALATSLADRFKIGHPTIQIETDPAGFCALAPDDVV